MNDAKSDPQHEQVRRQVDLVGQLASSTVLEEQGYDAAFEEITEAAAKFLDVDRISIWLGIAGTNKVRCVDAFTIATRSHEKGEVVDLSPRADYLESLGRQYVLAVDDAATDSRVDDIRETIIEPRGITAIIDAAIWNDGNFGGSVVASQFGGTRRWTPEEQTVMGILAEFAALILEKSRRLHAERKFQDFNEAASDWFWEMDADFRYTWVSDRMFEDWGFTRERVIGSTRWELVDTTEDPEKWRAHFATLNNHFPFRDFTYDIETPILGTRCISVSGRPFFEADGTFLGYRGSVSDITDVVLAEISKQQTETQFRELIEGSIQGVVIINEAGEILFCNDAYLRMFGFSSFDELTASGSSFDRTSPGDLEKILSRRNEIFETGKHFDDLLEFTAVRADGSTFEIEALTRGLRWNNAPAIQYTLIDITERKNSEQALAESEEKYRNLVDGSLQGIIVVVAGKVVFANKATHEILLYAPGSLVGLEVFSLVQPSDLSSMEKFREVKAEGLVEVNAIRGDGQPVVLQVMMMNVEWDGQPARQGTLVDITEHKTVEQHLRQSQKMEAIGQLTGGIAHDFNNLLAVILGNAEMLSDDLSDDAPDRIAALEGITRSAIRGSELTHRLLAFSRNQKLEPESIHLGDQVEAMIHILKRTLGVPITIETAETKDLWMAFADPGQVENALLNMALNSRDAMPLGGTLKIETANVNFEDETLAAQVDLEPGEYVMLAVTDTGVGMAKNVMDRVFEPFFSTKEVGKGTGLGLSMVFGFAKQSRGQVIIDSEEGEGTTVMLYLPRSHERLTEPADNDNGGIEGKLPSGETILVVEDSGEVRTLVVALLDSLGYTTLEAGDGETALRLIEMESSIDLLLTDVVLPGGMSGPDIAERVLEKRPAMKILYMSGYTDNAVLHQGRLDENAVLMQKPFRKSDLAEKIRSILDGD